MIICREKLWGQFVRTSYKYFATLFLENEQLQYRTFLISEDSKKVDRNIQNRAINEYQEANRCAFGSIKTTFELQKHSFYTLKA